MSSGSSFFPPIFLLFILYHIRSQFGRFNQCFLSSINSLPDKFSELLKYLFIPKENHFTELMDEINEHFGFVHQIIELGNALVDDAEFDKTEPSYTLNFDSDTYGHFNADIVDFSLVEPYVSFVKALISGIVVCLSIRRWRKRLPDIINGTGGD